MDGWMVGWMHTTIGLTERSWFVCICVTKFLVEIDHESQSVANLFSLFFRDPKMWQIYSSNNDCSTGSALDANNTDPAAITCFTCSQFPKKKFCVVVCCHHVKYMFVVNACVCVCAVWSVAATVTVAVSVATSFQLTGARTRSSFQQQP